MRTETVNAGYLIVVDTGRRVFDSIDGDVYVAKSRAEAALDRAKQSYPDAVIATLTVEVPAEPDFFEDTKVLREWLAGGGVSTEKLSAELRLWLKQVSE